MAPSVLVVLCLMAAVCVSGVPCLLTKKLFEAAVKKQQKDLQKLGCEPKPVLVYIEEELGPFNPLSDKNFYPHVVVVNRCLKNCSFCGSSRLGIPNEEEECLPEPKGIMKRSVALSFMERNEEPTMIHIEEHTSCKCT